MVYSYTEVNGKKYEKIKKAKQLKTKSADDVLKEEVKKSTDAMIAWMS